jgi:hypothetical protein
LFHVELTPVAANDRQTATDPAAAAAADDDDDGVIDL